MAAFANLAHYRASMPALLAALEAASRVSGAVNRPVANVLHLALLASPTVDADFCAGGARAAAAAAAAAPAPRVSAVADALAADDALEAAVVAKLAETLAPLRAALGGDARVRRVTFSVPNPRDGTFFRAAELTESTTPLRDAAAAFCAAVRSGSAKAAADFKSGAAGSAGAGAAAADAAAGSSSIRRRAGAIAGLPGANFPWIYTFRASLGYGEDR